MPLSDAGSPKPGSSRLVRRRKRSLALRLMEWLEMPRLTRAERNQRLAIAAAILAFALFLMLLPFLNQASRNSPPPKTPQAAPRR